MVKKCKKYGESCHFMAELFRIILIYPGDWWNDGVWVGVI